jgi:hypothetical protein
VRTEFALELEMSYRNEIIRVFVCKNRVIEIGLLVLVFCWFGGNRVETRLLKPGFQIEPRLISLLLFINPLSGIPSTSSP